jgi:hypothetical protein
MKFLGETRFDNAQKMIHINAAKRAIFGWSQD